MKTFFALCALCVSAVVSTSAQCTGTPSAQVPANVTAKMSYVAPGVAVNQLTSLGTNRFYYFDVPAYGNGELLYTNFAGGNTILSAKENGTKAQQISATLTGNQAFLSWDSKLAYYTKPVRGGAPGGEDIYGVLLFASGKCAEFRITSLDVAPAPPLPVWEVSSSSPAAGGWTIDFSPDTLLHQVTVQPSGTPVITSSYTLQDPESAGTFHRLRGNPKFRNIVMWKRNGTAGGTGAMPEVWLVDLNTCEGQICTAAQITNVVAGVKTPNPKDVPEGGHIAWSPDGLTIAFSEPQAADYWLARNVVNANGTLNPNFTLQEIGPFVKPQITADYCAFPRNWPSATLMACLAGPDSKLDTKMLYLLSTDGLGTLKILTATDAQVLTIGGTPMMQFAQDDTHILFNSDKTGVAQVYEASGFSYQVP